jgi:hypothetical protein
LEPTCDVKIKQEKIDDYWETSANIESFKQQPDDVFQFRGFQNDWVKKENAVSEIKLHTNDKVKKLSVPSVAELAEKAKPKEFNEAKSAVPEINKPPSNTLDGNNNQCDNKENESLINAFSSKESLSKNTNQTGNSNYMIGTRFLFLCIECMCII